MQVAHVAEHIWHRASTCPRMPAGRATRIFTLERLQVANIKSASFGWEWSLSASQQYPKALHCIIRNDFITGAILHCGKRNVLGTRRLWISVPLQMGRRSSKIATRKGAQDKKKAKLYGKVGKQIVSVVKAGGPNPTANVALAVLLQQAKESDIPKDIIERNIKRASEKGQEDFLEMTYEVYGFGGVGIVLEVLTDNNNRAAANVRDVVKKGGAKMADPGSVLFNFKRAGVINVKASEVNGDDLLSNAMDAGAEDILEPAVYEDEDEDEADQYYKVVTSAENFSAVFANLKSVGVPVDSDNSGLQLVPLATIEPDDEAVELNRALIEKLLDLDDVDAVYSTQK